MKSVPNSNVHELYISDISSSPIAPNTSSRDMGVNEFDNRAHALSERSLIAPLVEAIEANLDPSDPLSVRQAHFSLDELVAIFEV